MSQNVEVVDVESIKIGKRFKEIMKEKKKGNAFSIRAFGRRIGMGKDMLSDIANSLRNVRPSELEKMVKGLGLTVARFKREDTKQIEEELKQLVDKQSNLKRALELALTLLGTATGCSEKFFVLNNLGAVRYLLKDYKKAVEVWKEAHHYANEIKDLHGDFEPLYKVSYNLMAVYMQRKEYSILSRLLEDVEPSFANFSPRCSATLTRAQAIVAYNMGEFDECEEKTYEQLELFRLTNDSLLVATATHKLADMLYKIGKFKDALGYFKDAILAFEDKAEYRFIALKGYAKALVKVGEKDTAIEVIENSLQELEQTTFIDLRAKFLLLAVITTNNPIHADKLLSLDCNAETKSLACQFFMQYHTQTGDAIEVMKYHKIAMQYSNPLSEWEVI